MLYYLVRPLARQALKVLFKKIHLSHPERVPADKPVILAVNHPTIFIEPCLLACFLDRPIFFLTRGNLFKPPFVWVLKSLNMIPIFRMKDGGFEKVKNNFATLSYCFKTLEKKRMILIMAEGGCLQVKRLRPIVKGPTRLAFGSFEADGDLDIQVVPVGVNYTHPDQFRSEVMIEVGHPIKVSDYLAAYQQDNNQAARELTADLRTRMLEVVIHVADPADEPLADQLFEIVRNEDEKFILPIVPQNTDYFDRQNAVADELNQWDGDKKQEVGIKVSQYFNHLKKWGLSDYTVRHPGHFSFDNSIFLVIGFIPFLLGFLTNYLPFLVGKLFGKIPKEVETRLSVMVAVTFFAYIIYYGFILFFGLNRALPAWSNQDYSLLIYLFLIFLIPLWGMFSLWYMERFEHWSRSRKWEKLPKEIASQLSKRRTEILRYLP